MISSNIFGSQVDCIRLVLFMCQVSSQIKSAFLKMEEFEQAPLPSITKPLNSLVQVGLKK